MLHTNTVEPNTLELLKKLMSIQILDDFFLVGGTALSLQIGHRKSIDLDLFSIEKFDIQEILTCLKPDLIIQDSKKIHHCAVQNKVEWIQVKNKISIEVKSFLANL